MVIEVFKFVVSPSDRTKVIHHVIESTIGSDYQLKKGLNGKPYLVTPDHQSQLSISHSGSLLGIAMSRDGEIGLDIEYHDQDRSIIKIAKRFFSRKEYQYILQSHNQSFAFYKLWTIKEALIKLQGERITRLQQFQLPNPQELIFPNAYLHHENFTYQGTWSMSVACHSPCQMTNHPIEVIN
ncbi:MAG: hypothetical protein CMF42_03145 [Legionellales bacterium]|nr:hypothetical protein [Legionellales bacterium]OUX67766.1 MAG: hypothetical protein CBD38_02010 [bacterium TMED178]|tara:strand:+ start:6055 stop:6600 length:546 start_codon:yes stop_codon:yes gene_type:complete